MSALRHKQMFDQVPSIPTEVTFHLGSALYLQTGQPAQRSRSHCQT